MDIEAADANHTALEASAEDSGKAQGASVAASIFSLTNTIIGAGKLCHALCSLSLVRKLVQQTL